MHRGTVLRLSEATTGAIQPCFYVNPFGEWEIGSEESIKVGETVNIPINQ